MDRRHDPGLYEVKQHDKPLLRREKYNPRILFQLYLYFGVCLIALFELPNTFWNPSTRQVTLVIGTLGIWRYGWWFTHAVRALIYGRIVYPRYRDRGAQIWADGWRPRHLHFMLTTYKEHRGTSERAVRAICREVRTTGVPGTVWLGSSEPLDEDIIQSCLEKCSGDIDITLKIIRQNSPGKRMAIGLVLRAMSRSDVRDDDLVTFMDGDFILAPGAIQKCMPLFALFPDLQAVTTDEEVLCKGPGWVRTWLTMRFAQRRLAMQSHSLSGRVLTLTGRMSVFRARHVKTHEFIRLMEADHLDHWLWGNIRFLSGDDKSTWYYLLKAGARMLYVPDALGYTVEVIEGNGIDRMIQNFHRWSGNLLRNGSRTLALGPGQMPFFIWWCLVDQRLSMWTMLVSPVLALTTAILFSPLYLVAYIIFIAITRMMLSLFLYTYSREVHLAYPLLLYINQLSTAILKVYCLFRLSRQRWANRGNQKSATTSTGRRLLFQNTMAVYLTVLYVCLLFLGVTLYSGLLPIISGHMPTTMVFDIFQSPLNDARN